MMKGICREASSTNPVQALAWPTLDTTHALVATDQAASASAIAAVLRAAGYNVTVIGEATRVVAQLRGGRSSTELLVLDGTERPWVTAAILNGLRYANWALPIILIAGADRELRTEAKRLGVDAVLDAPLDPEQLRHTATRLAPIVPELEVKPAH